MSITTMWPNHALQRTRHRVLVESNALVGRVAELGLLGVAHNTIGVNSNG